MTRITDILHWYQYIYFTLSPSVLFRIRNVSNKRCRENQNTHFIFNNFFRKSCRLSDKVEKFCRVGQPKMMWRLRITCWITKSAHTHTHTHTHTLTHTHSQYVIIFAFPLPQWLYELASILRYTYIACLVYSTGDYKHFSARIWVQYSQEPNTLCNMWVMKIYLLIYFCLGSTQRFVLLFL